MKAWFRGIEKGRTVYRKIGYVDRCGTIGFLQGFSSFLFKRLVFLLLIINRPTVVELSSDSCRTINKTVIGRLIVSKAGITSCCFRNYCLGMIGIIYSKGGCKEINKIIYIIIWFIK